MIDLALITTCAPNVAPETIQEIIRVESKGNPLAININGGKNNKQPSSKKEATAIAQKAIALGYTVDMGLMQINSNNLKRLGLSVEKMWDPCINIQAGAAIITENYIQAKKQHGEGQPALQAALSAYNTGSFTKGLANGYVNQYYSLRYQPMSLALNDTKYITKTKIVKMSNPYISETTIFKRG